MTDAEQKLTDFRAQIDAIDEELAQLLLKRCGVVQEVAALKKKNWPADCHIRSGREGKMHQAIAKRFIGTDIPPTTALAIWRQFIGAATQLESPLHIGTIATHPHHAWLGREYFGVGATVSVFPSVQSVLRSIASAQCNIMLLPPPNPHASGWYEAETLNKSGFMIFARLPVSTQPLPNNMGGALAFAGITPEPSGDDISYFLRDKKVEVMNGFHTAHDNALYLGSHPRPIQAVEE